MQYGIDILPYERIKRRDEEGKSSKNILIKELIKLIVYFLASFLISRVIMVNLMAPFGIAFLISNMLEEENSIKLTSALGTIVGYISIHSSVKDIWMYLILVPLIILNSYILRNKKEKSIIKSVFILVFLEVTIYNRFKLHISPLMSITNSIFQTSCVFSLYYIINYSKICAKGFKTKHLFNSEEIISMCITLSLIISGVRGLNIFGLSIRNIIALSIIVMIGYIKGSSVGGACGVAMGVIIGISTNDMTTFVGVFGICGLISGIFKESGKVISGLSYVVAFAILKLYSDIGIQFEFREVLLGSGIFSLIPNKIYKKIETDLDWEMKSENIKDDYISKVKDIVQEKLTEFSQLLLYMGDTLENLAENHNLQMKKKSSSIVEKLADRVCSGCNMKHMCWKREGFYTYSAFSELINNFENKKKVIPNEIERKCIKRSVLVKNAEEIIKNYIIDEMWKKRINEYRNFLAEQITNISYSVEELTENINSQVHFNKYLENDIRRILNKNKIKYQDIFAYNDKLGKIIVKIHLSPCGGKQKCIKEILPFINKVTGKIMCISDDCCNIDSNNERCEITLEESPKYHVATHAGAVCKDGETYSGDSYTYGKLKDGKYITVISDGMGSGPEAGQESNAAVNLIEKFAKIGFDRINAINMVNSLMTINFSENEKFSTVDLSDINLYTGEVDFMKVGAVPSFIKSNGKVEVISSKTLPIGVLDKVDVDLVKKDIDNGDIIVMLSDGVLDYDDTEIGKVDWIVKYLEETNMNKPEDICKDIMEKAKLLRKGKVKDDMTVVVSKVYSLY
ncbi:stage II sporulation protein E [Clostridium tetani]|uniref:stage II sporulation protein E n=1 Tax=Clostridium tetani TaxID=1513 RepID=UPI002952D96A|nr:stage II sporulation protein E [Clostridium tetani]BDR73955.1 stage II sporulation protein E [Clostridium tetani]